MGGRMLDTAQAAKRLGCSAAHVGNMIRSGKIAAINISHGGARPTWRIQEETLLEFMQAAESTTLQRMHTREGV